MTSKIISTKIPNPDPDSDPGWIQWNTFIASHSVPISNAEVVRRYQNIEQNSSSYLEANQLNHFLNLRHFGCDSHYANLAETFYDLKEDEYPVEASVSALEAEFSQNGCRFTADSVVFKGVSSEPFYEIHCFKFVQPGQTIQFHGFLSTSVCRYKALDFAHTQGVLLVIRGLDSVDCIVPKNSTVNTTVNAHVPEHEVLLGRGATMKVQKVIPATPINLREVHLKVLNQKTTANLATTKPSDAVLRDESPKLGRP